MKQGLYAAHIFKGKSGALDYIRQAGCIQFDPVDCVGKNAELTLQSRVKGFQKKDLYELLDKDRILFDYTDKEFAIIPTEDWPYYKRTGIFAGRMVIASKFLKGWKRQLLTISGNMDMSVPLLCRSRGLSNSVHPSIGAEAGMAMTQRHPVRFLIMLRGEGNGREEHS